MTRFDWPTVHLEEIAAPIRNALVGGPFGSNLVSRDYVDSGVPVIRGQNMGYGRWVGGDFAYVSPDKAKLLSANLARPGDIVFTQRGTLGQVAIIPPDGHKYYVISQSQMKLTVDKRKVDPHFIYYQFRSPDQQEYIQTNAVRTGVPHTNLSILRSTPICLPPLQEQQKISEALGLLDDKIELNCQTARTLEELAQRLFKSWFVDFEPVRAKMAGRQPTHMPPETAALFPDKLVNSPLGKIPEGWVHKQLNDVANVAIGRTPPRKEGWWFTTNTKDNAWASIKDMGAQGAYIEKTSEFLTDAALEKHRMKLVKPGSVLFSFKMTVGRVKIVDRLMATNEAIAQIDGSNGLLPNEFIYLCLMNGPDMSMESTSSIAVATNSKGVKGIPILCPTGPILSEFISITNPLFKRMRSLQRESDILIELRDRLLPKLIGGAIRVSNVDG